MTTSDSNLDENNWESFYKEFNNESPRGAVIISAAFIDTLLRDLLSNFMIGCNTDITNLLGSDDQPHAPLGNFHSKIAASYFLGFLTKSEFDDLNLINQIRNKFAHKKHGFTFSEKIIVDKCNLLQTPNFFSEYLQSVFNSPYDRFLFTVSQLAMRIGLRIPEVLHERRKEREEIQIVYKFIPGKENKDLFQNP